MHSAADLTYKDMDVNTPQTVETLDHTPVDHDENRLPWTAPILGVFEAARLTLGDVTSGSTDGFINTRAS